MKWYENIVDCGDGSNSVSRYRTLEEAERAAELEFNSYGIPVDGPNLIDTDSTYFFNEVEDEDDFLTGKTCNPDSPEECEVCQ